MKFVLAVLAVLFAPIAASASVYNYTCETQVSGVDQSNSGQISVGGTAAIYEGNGSSVILVMPENGLLMVSIVEGTDLFAKIYSTVSTPGAMAILSRANMLGQVEVMVVCTAVAAGVAS